MLKADFNVALEALNKLPKRGKRPPYLGTVALPEHVRYANLYPRTEKNTFLEDRKHVDFRVSNSNRLFDTEVHEDAY